MPALRTCGRRWSAVGSDDFAIPALLAIIPRLVFIGLLEAVLLRLYFTPLCDVPVPTSVYSLLFAIKFLMFVVCINETIIFAISSRGTIMNTKPRRHLAKALYVRVVLFFVEVALTAAVTYVLFAPSVLKDFVDACKEPRELRFAHGVVIAAWVVKFLFAVVFLIVSDPCGCFTSGLHKEVVKFYEYVRTRRQVSKETQENELLKEAAEGFMKMKRNRSVVLHPGGMHQIHVRSKLERFFRFFGVKRSHSQRFALDNLARAVQGLFGDLDLVPSDILAGVILLRRSQKKEIREGKNLVQPLRELTMQHLMKYEKDHIPVNYQYSPPEDITTLDTTADQEVVMEMCYYVNYAIGIYGWQLHVYMNLCCGLCQLARKTCCNHRCSNPRVSDGDFVHDNTCLCSLATFRFHTDTAEDDIVYLCCENNLFQTPFCVSLDHSKRAVVLSIRGTLSIQDAITDMNVYPENVDVPHCANSYIHGGFLESARWIQNRIETKQVLQRAFHNREEYKLVITGHSLGAGVASVLAVLYHPQYGDRLMCYAFSPPGCVFSLPLAHHTRSFIKTFLVGSDLIPRLNWRSLNYFKRSLLTILHKCKLSKHRVLFRGLFYPPCCSQAEDPTFTIKDLRERAWEDKLACRKRATKPEKEEPRRATLKNKYWQLVQGKVRQKHLSRVQRTLQEAIVPEMPAFCPGKIMVVKMQKSKAPGCFKSCYPNEVASITWNSPEEMCMFEINDSSLENHMPHAVLTALKALKKQIEEEGLPGRESGRVREGTQESELPPELDPGIELQSVEVDLTAPKTDDVNTHHTSLVTHAEVLY